MNTSKRKGWRLKWKDLSPVKRLVILADKRERDESPEMKAVNAVIAKLRRKAAPKNMSKLRAYLMEKRGLANAPGEPRRGVAPALALATELANDNSAP